jgi:dTDP-glucose 4,6-dehydratase
MRYFVTGGAGFIGSNYVRGLLGGAWGFHVESVTVFDAFTYAGNTANLESVASDPRLSVVTGDIRIAADIDGAIPGHDVVVHFAAESHVDRSIESSSVFITTNVLGTQQMLEATMRHSIPTFVHVSTDEVYGSITKGSWDENQPLLPNNPYAASKASSDLLARAYAHTYGLDVRITRSSNNFGTYQYPEKVIPLFITNLIDGLKVPLYGDGLNIRDWLHVDDHCSGIELVVQGGRSGEVYNIGGGTELANRELASLILAPFGVSDEMIQPVADRPGHDRRYSLDWSKINSELGYLPTKSLESSIGEVVDWYRSHESWWRPLKDKK